MERIGRYEILRELGRGGFGRVYLANDPLMKCEVAIKVMSNADDPEMLARFRDEAASARKLRHESIVTIYDVGDERGVPYIVMEYLQGMDLQKIRDQNVRLSLVEKVRILSQTAAGLQVAHENGIIHRDVKPANIMVLKDGSVKIMDFGIARFNGEGATRHTRTGVLVGTLQYIPPEQFEGHPVDPMADLWAFGVIAYQMFSGRNPFEAAETMQVIYNITSLPIPELHQLNPEVPEDLCQLVRKLLTRERSARYQTFEDLRVDLNPVLESLEEQEANRLVDDARMIAARGDLQRAHQIVRRVLDRRPSNSQAKQIRDHIITQVRAVEITKQVEELLKRGDEDFSAGSYEEAANSYRQAYRLNPRESTARMRMERAQKMAERARRIREELNEARVRLSAGEPKEAQRILAAVLADDPENAEAAGLQRTAGQARGRQEDAARADAILYARHLAAQRQFAQALDALATCGRKLGEHPDLQGAVEQVRRAEAAVAAQARMEEAIAKASEHVRNGEYAAASVILTPLATEFPANADIRELVKFVTQEEARARRVMAQRAAQERAAQEQRALLEKAARETVPAGVPPIAKPDRATTIARALEMSRQHAGAGRIPEAVHVLDVALSRYSDAVELVNERLRLVAPAPAPLAEATNPVSTPQAPSDRQRSLSLSMRLLLGRRMLWAGIAAVGAVAAGLGYWQSGKAPHHPPAQQQEDLQSPATRSPGETEFPSSTHSRPALPEPKSGEPPAIKPSAEVSSPKPVPPLASLLPPTVTLTYSRGSPSNPNREALIVERSPLHAAAMGSGTWLAVSTSAGRVLLDLKFPSVASLPPGTYRENVLVTSNREEALVRVLLKVAEVEKPPLATEPEPQLAAPTPPTHDPVPPKTQANTILAPKRPYNGVKRGQVTWAGSLPAGARLVLGQSGVQQGPGIQDGEFPPVDVQVQVTLPPVGIDVQPQPPPNAERLVITNSTGATVSQIRLSWSVK
jgi:serine/threonine protein kinase